MEHEPPNAQPRVEVMTHLDLMIRNIVRREPPRNGREWQPRKHVNVEQVGVVRSNDRFDFEDGD